MTLREISAEFDAADVPFDGQHQPAVSGERRGLVEQHYHAVDFSKWSDVRKVLQVYENVLSELEEKAMNPSPHEDQFAKKKFASLKKWIERDGFVYRDGRLTPVAKEAGLPEIQEVAARFDAPELHRQIDRLKNAVFDDPALAIGTAKELIETTCKTILNERGISYTEDCDLGPLVKETRRTLGLLSEDVPDSAKGAEVIRRILSNLGTVAQGLAELRNLYGTGHGRTGNRQGLSQRHARLAVGAAATLATFLLETHSER